MPSLSNPGSSFFPSNSGNAGGDLSGNYPNPTVRGIQGIPIEAAAPANGDALIYNVLLNEWVHAPVAGGGPVGPAGGDLSGVYPNPGVTGLQTNPLPVAVADGFLKRNALNTGWEEVTYGAVANTVCQGNDTRLTNSRTPTGPASGDLTGNYPNPTVDGLQGNPVSAAAPASSQALIWDGAAWTPTTLPPPTGTAGGDLSGTYPSPTVDGLQGNPVAATVPSTNDVLTWNGAAWTPSAPPTATIGSFSDSTSQPIPASVVYYVRYNTTELSAGVVVQNDGLGNPTQIKVNVTGTYAFSISPQMLKGGAGATVADFWLVINGTPVPRSASRFALPNNTEVLPYLEIIVPMTAGQYAQWAFYTTGTNVSIIAAGASPPIPAAPSVIVGVKRIA